MGISWGRSDLYNFADFWKDWDVAMKAQGFSSGWLLKEYLLDSPYLERERYELYELQSHEARKERWSRDINWKELPPGFFLSRGSGGYQSPHLDEVRLELNAKSRANPDPDGRFPPIQLDPYRRALDQFWIHKEKAEEKHKFSRALIDETDNDYHISLTRRFFDPVDRSVSYREVFRCIEQYCDREAVLKMVAGKSSRGRPMASCDMGNGLRFCFAIHEIQTRSYGQLDLKLHSFFALVRADQVLMVDRFQIEFPWFLRSAPLLWSACGVKTTPEAFYVGLASRLVEYGLLCRAFANFFDDETPTTE